MDKFGIPKKINRHVLKAICTLHGDGNDHPSINDICDAVEITMRNNVPVRNLQAVVVQSLQNMTDCGVIEEYGSNYFLRNLDASPSVSGKSSNDSEMNKPNERGMDTGSATPGSKGALYESSSGGDFIDSPRESQRPSESRLDRLSSGEMDSDDFDQLKVDMPTSVQDTEMSSSFLHRLANLQNYFQTPNQSVINAVTSGVCNLPRHNDQTIGNEHHLKIMNANLNGEGSSPSEPRDEDTKDNKLINAEEHET